MWIKEYNNAPVIGKLSKCANCSRVFDIIKNVDYLLLLLKK
jgi:hypothetical protein